MGFLNHQQYHRYFLTHFDLLNWSHHPSPLAPGVGPNFMGFIDGKGKRKGKGKEKGKDGREKGEKGWEISGYLRLEILGVLVGDWGYLRLEIWGYLGRIIPVTVVSS